MRGRKGDKSEATRLGIVMRKGRIRVTWSKSRD